MTINIILHRFISLLKSNHLCYYERLLFCIEKKKKHLIKLTCYYYYFFLYDMISLWNIFALHWN